MKHAWICLLVVVCFVACKGKVKTDESKAKPATAIEQTKLQVDFSKQEVDTVLLNATDTAFVVKNKSIKDDMGDKQKNYIIKVFFAPKNWPVLTFNNAIGADIALQNDLDGDGQPELLLRPEWFSSCWSSVNLFSLKHHTWKLVKTGSMYFCSEEYPLKKRIIKTAKGYGLLTDSLTDDKFITLKKEIKF